MRDKNNISQEEFIATDSATTAKNEWRKLLKPIGKGLQEARFKTKSPADWDGRYEKMIGTSTRKIFFDDGVLTDDHIDSILGMGSTVCHKLWQFIFKYWDVSYDANNTAKNLTDEAVVRLAKACPKLRRVQLQAVHHVGGGAMRALFENCPDLTSLEITCITGPPVSWNPMFGQALDALRKNPGWAPKLKNLIVTEREENKEFMKPMRALGKERPGLMITLLTRSECKKWGDYEMETTKTKYKGRKQPWSMSDYREYSRAPGW